jgi:predicted nucleic acid-binding protein
LEVFTSLLTVAEVVKVGDEKPDEAMKRKIERLILSGRDGIKVVGLNPSIATLARDLCSDDGIKGRSADRVHLATAIHVGCAEFLTFDDKLEKRVKKKEARGCKLLLPSKSLLLPTEYRATDMFEAKGAEEKKPR